MCLQIHRHVADFVEEESAAIGVLDLPLGPGESACKSALLLAEQFRRDEVGGYCSTIDRNEAAGVSLRLLMNGAGCQFLAGAALAGDEDGFIGLGVTAEHISNLPHRFTVAYDVGPVL